MARSFISTRSTVPPGGVWFFQLGDDHYESPIYEDVVKHVGQILEKHGSTEDAAEALANFMCPHLPAYFCRGEGPVSPVITPREAMDAAMPFFKRQVETSDVIMKRMEACTMCPRHRRDFCLHCHGYDQWIYDGFGGRRVRLPSDDASGCCECTKTFEAVAASAVYQPGEGVWEGAPATCWRNNQ